MTTLRFTTACLLLLFSYTAWAGGASPNANFNINKTIIRKGKPVIFTDVSTKGNCTQDLNSWNWDFGEGATPATANTQGPHEVTYATVGEKSISLRVDGPGSCSSRSLRKTIMVTEPPIPTMSHWALVICGLLMASYAVSRIWKVVKGQAIG